MCYINKCFFNKVDVTQGVLYGGVLFTRVYVNKMCRGKRSYRNKGVMVTLCHHAKRGGIG